MTIIDDGYYTIKYKTAEARALYLVAKKEYTSLGKMSRALGFGASYVATLVQSGIPVKYAGFLGRKFGFHPAVLAYEKWIEFIGNTKETLLYDNIVQSSPYFTRDDAEYILKGSYIKDPVKHLRLLDKKVK